MLQECAAKLQQDKDHVNCFFIGKVWSFMSMPLQAKQLIRSTTSLLLSTTYLKVVHLLRGAMQQKWPQLQATGDWQLHHNNAPSHASHFMQRFL